MRRLLVVFFSVLFFLISLPVYAAKDIIGRAVVEVESLNVRSGPSKEYEKIGMLSQGICVDVMGLEEPDWYLIDFEGTEGYINGEYVIFTPWEEEDAEQKEYPVVVLVTAILIVACISIFTLAGIRREEDEDDAEGEEEIPITDHDDTNMHLGEVTYDTYRIDIDPKYFEMTSSIPQPDSVYDEKTKGTWKEDVFGRVEKGSKNLSDEALPDTASLEMLDTRLEQASAQIAALQKEVEELKKQQPDSI